jgi:hypothetical protein
MLVEGNVDLILIGFRPQNKMFRCFKKPAIYFEKLGTETRSK